MRPFLWYAIVPGACLGAVLGALALHILLTGRDCWSLVAVAGLCVFSYALFLGFVLWCRRVDCPCREEPREPPGRPYGPRLHDENTPPPTG
jgi:hypothetical protein